VVENRKPVWVWPNEIPIDGKPEWIQETQLPKLLFYVIPGAIVNAAVVDWSEANLKNLETIDLGEGLYFLQEDHPNAIGKGLANWIQRQNSASQ
jgi:haloalkane dehalogenase